MRNNLETEKEHLLFLDGMKTVIIAKHINWTSIYLNLPNNSNTGKNDWSVFTMIDTV